RYWTLFVPKAWAWAAAGAKARAATAESVATAASAANVARARPAVPFAPPCPRAAMVSFLPGALRTASVFVPRAHVQVVLHVVGGRELGAPVLHHLAGQVADAVDPVL